MNDYRVRGNPTTGLIGATLGFFIGFAGVALFGSTIKSFEGAVGGSAASAGLLISIPTFTGSLLRIPFSAWVDTTGGRKPFLVLLVLSILGLGGLYAVLAAGTGGEKSLLPGGGLLPSILLFGALGGCGIATFSVGISQTAYWFPQRKQGGALGTYAGVGNLAPGVFIFLLTWFALPALGLAGAYLAWLVFLAAGTVLYLLIGRNAPYFQILAQGAAPDKAKEIASSRHGQELFPRQRFWKSLSLSASRWQTWALTAVYFTTFGGFIALTAWLPKYWTSYFFVPLRAAGLLTLSFSMLASLVRVAGGRISDRFGGESTALTALAITLAGSIVMTFSTVFGVSLAAVLVMASGMGMANAAVFKLVPQRVPDSVGGAAGWVGGLGAFGGFVFPNVLALFLGRAPGAAAVSGASAAASSASAGAGVQGEAGGLAVRAVEGWTSGDPGYARGFVVFAVLSLVSILITFILKARAGDGTKGK